MYKVIPADFVSLEDGSGLVHIAPAFGAEDMEAIKAQNKELRKQGLPEFPVILNVGEDGAFTFDVAKWAGMFVKDADPLIIKDMEERGVLFKQESHEHDYPFCWRCKTPLLYYAKMSWFIKMTELRDQLIKNNDAINWVPAYLKEGRFGEWLREVKDWAVSRDRYWGTPLPVWRCACGHTEVIGSVKELLEKKYSKNRFFVVRHGESGRQLKKIASCWPEPEPQPLTEAGKQQVQATAQILAKEKIDLIVASDLLRTKQTAEILSQATGAKIIYDKDLREVNVGIFNGGDPKKYWEYLDTQKNRFTAKPEKGESLVGVRKRTYESLARINGKYVGKNIVLVAHELPLTVLEFTLKGLDLATIIEDRYSEKIKRIETGAWRAVDFKELPFNDLMEIDLHRPYIDAVMPVCPECSDRMRRVPEVCDCWLDSGSMPLAQNHWPFEKGQAKGKTPKLFPADFISEAIDQTRGWFYTLLAVSTVMKFGAPYRNVVSLGHVLDEKGDKMSKSKGNVVNPWEMVDKYGADAVRWYFYTVNDPGDPKLYAEKDLDLALKKFLLTFWNCHVFLQTYASGVRAPKTVRPANILDKWIVQRFDRTAAQVTGSLDKYDIAAAARAIESFTINDLSLWYVRRSRRRLQQPKNAVELKQAASVFAYILENLAKLAAPFIPFLSEEIWQELSGNNYAKAKSVHLESWPFVVSAKKGKPSAAKGDLLEQMDKVRELVAAVLAERAKKAVKVRQPLARMTVGGKIKLDKALVDLLAQEVNVKKVVFDPELKSIIDIDWTITPELKEEGMVREIMRQIQELRKAAKFTPADKIVIFIQADGELKGIIAKNQAMMVRETKAVKLEFGKAESAAAEVQTTVDKLPLGIGIKKC
jgi:isoleucyl-tRNA synthetase